MNHKDINDRNAYVRSNEIEELIKNLPAKESSGLNRITVNSIGHLKKK
jgi:hypothetical protein